MPRICFKSNIHTILFIFDCLSTAGRLTTHLVESGGKGVRRKEGEGQAERRMNRKGK